MHWRALLVSCCLALLLRVMAESQSTPQPPESSNPRVIVPESAAALVRPILDEKQKSGPHDQSRLSNLMYALTGHRGVLPTRRWLS